MANTIEQELQHYLLQLNEAEKKSVLQLLKTFVKGRKQKQKRMTIEEYNEEINEALAEAEKGDVYTHEEVVKMVKNW